ncbi:MAG: adenylyl-sulfate kinase [Rickettsiales bacterium]
MTYKDSTPLNLVIVGHVDHGKSTLVGRLLHDTDSLPDGKMEAIQQSCKKRGMPFEWSFLLDALQAERDQGITIDTTQIWLKTPKRDIVIIDAPGHKEFLKNMITGAAQADAALVIIDAKEGIREQSKRHGYLLHLLGVRQVAVIVNKMDAIGFDEQVFANIEKEYRAYLKTLDITPTCFIPISARDGDNVAATSDNTPWYKGESVLSALDHFAPAQSDEELPLRFLIQDVYKFDDRRILAGRVESGIIRVGDTLLFSPSNVQAKVSSIESWPGENAPQQASAGQSIGITLDDQIFIERGHVASHVEDAPMLTTQFRARLFWLSRESLATGKRYKIKLGTSEAYGEIKSIEHVVDASSLTHGEAEQVERNNVAEVVIRLRGLTAVDHYGDQRALARFVIQQDYDIAGGGIISMDGFLDQRNTHSSKAVSENIFDVDTGVSSEQRALQNGHFGGILWLTGLSGSGKSTVAKQLHRRLFDKGYQVYMLDGDNIRQGLARDLGFSPEDRSENIRRVAEVASLFAQAGVIVITSFISPYVADRKRARALLPQSFHTVYVKATVEACEKRDTKGLYAKARKGEIPDFTGISAPYEEPENPDVVLDTEAETIEESVKKLLTYVEDQLVQPAHNLMMEDKGGQVRDVEGSGI